MPHTCVFERPAKRRMNHQQLGALCHPPRRPLVCGVEMTSHGFLICHRIPCPFTMNVVAFLYIKLYQDDACLLAGQGITWCLSLSSFGEKGVQSNLDGQVPLHCK